MATFLSRVAFAFVAFSACTSALYIERSETPASCETTVVIGSSTVAVGESTVLIETLACSDAQSPTKRGLFPRPPAKTSTTATPTSSSAAAPSSTPVNVCGQICNDVCAMNGILPPISEDCQTIYNSITILQGSVAPTFDVPANGIQQLTFGTCRVFFNNFSTKTITSCWASLSQEASAAGTICFPPTQPVQSLGLCNAADSTWQIGVGHS
ncbi:hypothetical protein BC629DRAFT_784253 [Irpex lacteus]|nr:hypothetical protein BC629DRAFT_784253 [Irpex lacteus]